MTQPTAQPSNISGPSRRGVLATAAWTAPVVTVAMAAPAYATSACVIPADWAVTQTLTGPDAAFTSTFNGAPAFNASDVADVASTHTMQNTGAYTFAPGELVVYAGFAFPVSAGGINSFDPAAEVYPTFEATSVGAGWVVETTPMGPYPTASGYETYIRFTWNATLAPGGWTTPLTVTAKANPTNAFLPPLQPGDPKRVDMSTSIGWGVDGLKCDSTTVLTPADGGYEYPGDWWVLGNM